MIRSRVPVKLPTGTVMNSNPFEKSALEPCFCLCGSTVWSLRCAFMITVSYCVVRAIHSGVSKVDVESVSDVASFVESDCVEARTTEKFGQNCEQRGCLAGRRADRGVIVSMTISETAKQMY